MKKKRKHTKCESLAFVLNPKNFTFFVHLLQKIFFPNCNSTVAPYLWAYTHKTIVARWDQNEEKQLKTWKSKYVYASNGETNG